MGVDRGLRQVSSSAVNQTIGRFKMKYKCQFKDQPEMIFPFSGITDSNQ